MALIPYERVSDEIALECISRVSLEGRRSFPQVSKSWKDAFYSGEVYKRRKALKISEKCLTFFYFHFVDLSEESYFDGTYKSFLHLKMYNTKTRRWFPFAFFQLQHSDGKPLEYNGGSIKLNIVTVDSDIYIIPQQGSEFWVFRGKSHDLERMNLPNGKNWQTIHAHTFGGKLIFVNHFNPEIDGVDIRILCQNGEWISNSFWTLRFHDISIGVSDDNLHFYAYRPHHDGAFFGVMFDLEKFDWSVKSKPLDGNLECSLYSQNNFTYLNGIHFQVKLVDHEDDKENGKLKLERFDKRTNSWVQLPQVECTPKGYLQIYPLGDTLQILTEPSGTNDFLVLNVFKVFQKGGEISGNWDLVNSKIDCPEANCEAHLPGVNCEIGCNVCKEDLYAGCTLTFFTFLEL